MSMLVRAFAPVAFALASCALPLGSSAALAETMSDWSAPGGTAVRLIGGAAESGTLAAGVEIRLEPGWKTYWRYPGDSGVPPRFDWTGSTNVRSVDISWPAPVRFDTGGSYSIGYMSDVVIPFRVTPERAGEPITLRLNIDYAVCEKICQPSSAALELDLAPEGTPSPTLDAAFKRVPDPARIGAKGDLAIEGASLQTSGDEGTIRVETKVSKPGTADLFVEGPDENWALPLPSREAGANGTTVFVLPVDGVPGGADIARTPLRFTLVEGNRAVEVAAPLSGR